MFNQLRPALTLLGLFSVLLGLIYPLAITGVAQVLMPVQANGSMVMQNGVVTGSSLIGQPFSQPRYLHPRPSATDPDYNASSSGGSNLGPSSAALLAGVTQRAAAYGPLPVPSDMATTSASGLDPHVSLDGALRQVERIADARWIAAADVERTIRTGVTGPAFGFVGNPIINVLKANLALDALGG